MKKILSSFELWPQKFVHQTGARLSGQWSLRGLDLFHFQSETSHLPETARNNNHKSFPCQQHAQIFSNKVRKIHSKGSILYSTNISWAILSSQLHFHVSRNYSPTWRKNTPTRTSAFGWQFRSSRGGRGVKLRSRRKSRRFTSKRRMQIPTVSRLAGHNPVHWDP